MQGWRSGESSRLPPLCHGFDVCCWFSSLLRGFFSGVFRFSSPAPQNQHSIFHFVPEMRATGLSACLPHSLNKVDYKNKVDYLFRPYFVIYLFLTCFHAQAAIDKKIEDNPAIALKALITSREEEEERQEIQLMFGQSTYCHHRAVREIWRNLEDSKKRELVVCKNTVHPVFSTSFGLHVAVLTADSPQKFIFARRANRGSY